MATNALAQFIYDPSTSAYFSAQDQGGGSMTAGGGDGSGWIDWSQVPGFERFAQSQANGVSGGRGENVLAALQQSGLRIYDQPLENGMFRRGLVDASGNPVGQLQDVQTPSDRGFWNAAMLAAAGVGAGVGSGYIGGAEAAGTAGSAAGSSVGAGASGAGAAGSAAGAAGAGAMGGSGMWAQLASTALQSYQANQAAGDMRAASDAAIAEQRRQYDQTREDFAPYREAGVGALGQLQTELGRTVTPEEVMSDPGYAFGLQQGQQAIDRRIAASGGRISGQAIKAAGRFGTDYATSGYNAAYQRRQDRLNRIAALAGVGQTATGSSAAAGANASNAISGLISGQGYNNAAGRVAQGNIWGDTINQFGAMYGRRQPQSGGYGGQAGWSSDPNADPYYMGGP